MQIKEPAEAKDKAPPPSTADLEPATPEKDEGPGHATVQRAARPSASALPTSATEMLAAAGAGTAPRARMMGRIQQTMGNARVSRMFDTAGPHIHRICACGGEAGPDGECEACRQKGEGTLQRATRASDSIDQAPSNARDMARGPERSLGAAPQMFTEEHGQAATSRTGQSTPAAHMGGKLPSMEERQQALSSRGAIPSNTVVCATKWTPCRAPYSPGSWAAKVTYHCPVFPGLPGTTKPAYVTIPDEFIGTDPTGRDMYRCRRGFQVRFWLEVADTIATTLTRGMLFPSFEACHAGYRANLYAALAVLFRPSGGGRPWGGRVNRSVPAGGFPCP
jgi:hypothetical protein